MVDKIIKKLCECDGVSGDENSVSMAAAEILSEFSKVETDKNFNVCAVMGNLNSDYHIMLDAHIDQIGFVVTEISDNGIIKFTSIGGVDKRILPGTTVKIRRKENVFGVIISKNLKNKAVTDFEDLFIDTNLKPDRLKQLVSVGDTVVIDNSLNTLLNGRISGKSLDDRCGAAALIYCAKLLADEDLPFKLSIILSVQEETSSLGAKTKAFEIFPDEAVVVDVSFAKQFAVSDDSYAQLGKGAMIGISPILDRKNTNLMGKIAKNKGIPFQFEVMSGSTGTNSDSISVSGAGISTALLSIPLRYMHTGVEVIDIKDAENTALLIKEYLLAKGENLNV